MSGLKRLEDLEHGYECDTALCQHQQRAIKRKVDTPTRDKRLWELLEKLAVSKALESEAK